MANIIEQLVKRRLVPVVAIDDAADAEPLGDALVDGGLPVAEITFRTDAAIETIRTLAKRGDILVGAGTVLSVDQVKQAVDAGALFVVSPGFSSRVVEYCLANDITITPGTATPSDLQQAVEHGLQVVKYFPAEAMGGLKTLKAISAPFGMLQFVPTGGISAENLADYLAFANTLAVGGSWMVAKTLIQERRFQQIAERTAEAVRLVEQAEA